MRLVLVLSQTVLVRAIEKLADRLRAPPMAEHEQEHETSGRSQHGTVGCAGDQREVAKSIAFSDADD